MNKKPKTNKTFIFCIVTIFLVFIFFYHTLNYGAKIYDELTVLKETYLPTCFSISEIFELISLIGLHHHFESSNTLYSNIVSLRCNPFGNFLQLFTQYFFQKSSFNYHLYSLCLHLINTTLVFLTITNIGTRLVSFKECNTRKLFISSVLTLLWATHPANIESVLLITNANIVLSYSLSLLTFYIYLTLLPADYKSPRLSFLNSFSLFIVFLLALFTAEFHFMLPLILIAYTSVMNLHYNYKRVSFTKSFPNCFYSALQATLPLFVAAFSYAILFLISNTKMNFETHSSFRLILERVFWFSPQILFHFIKLLFFPIKLSIDQTFLVKIAKTIFDPYAVFCISFIVATIFISLLSLLKANKRYPFFFIIFFLFLLSLIPYSQIIAPIYNLASERYLYFPSFILIFGLSHLIFFILNKYKGQKKLIYLIVFLLTLIQLTYSTRAFIRTLDWKDASSLYMAAIKATNNPLYKAYRYKGLTPQEKIFARYPEMEVDPKYQNLAINNLKKAIVLFKKEKSRYQSSIPFTVKSYGLDPATLLAKTGFILSKSDFILSKNPQKALNLIKPYLKDLSLFDSAGLSFYGSLLYYNQMPDKAEEVLRYGFKKYPYTTRIIFPLCDLIQIKYGDLKEIEKYSLHAFKYFPYDPFTLLILTKIYKLKGDFEKYAHFSYIYGLRQHSLEDLNNAYNTYLFLNKRDKAEKIKEKMIDIEKNLKKRRYVRLYEN